MKKMLLIMFMTSMGFASNAWSAQAGASGVLQEIKETDVVNVVPRPGKPLPPR